MGQLKVAASYLLVLHNLESIEQSSEDTVCLLKAAITAQDWPVSLPGRSHAAATDLRNSSRRSYFVSSTVWTTLGSSFGARCRTPVRCRPNTAPTDSGRSANLRLGRWKPCWSPEGYRRPRRCTSTSLLLPRRRGSARYGRWGWACWVDRGLGRDGVYGITRNDGGKPST
jgi:hypothetical protein